MKLPLQLAAMIGTREVVRSVCHGTTPSSSVLVVRSAVNEMNKVKSTPGDSFHVPEPASLREVGGTSVTGLFGDLDAGR